MPSRITASGLASLLLIVAGCSSPSLGSSSGRGPSNGPGTDTDTDEAEAPAAPDDETGGGPRSTGPLGLIVIDEQRVFFDGAAAGNPRASVADLTAKSARLFALAGDNHVPVFITYEASKSGDHALHPSLVSSVPASAQEFIKTTFAATGQSKFLPALKASGARRLMVIGAETDVCVLQTILGLRRAGFEVLAVRDVLFSEEVNTGPALRRMRQAGVVELGMKAAEELLASGGSSPAPPASKSVAIVRPLEMGFVLHDLAGLGAADPDASAKMVRLRELLLVSEWFRIPLLAADPPAALAALPANLRSIVKRPIVPLASRPSNVTQLAVAGGRAGLDAALTSLAAQAEVFMVEDSLLGAADLEALYAGGAVPTTYKSLYYELTQSVSDAEWPSQQWVTDGATYFDLTKAPEDLPPLAVP